MGRGVIRRGFVMVRLGRGGCQNYTQIAGATPRASVRTAPKALGTQATPQTLIGVRVNTGRELRAPFVLMRDSACVSRGDPVHHRRATLLAPHTKLATPEAANYVGSRAKTLEKWRVVGGGPRYVKLGRRVVYEVSDLDAWIDERRRRSTSEQGMAA